MESLFKRTLKHGPRHLSARLKSLRSPPLTDGHVLMIHTGRSGSTVLGKMLDQHSEIFWDGETIEKLFHQLSEERGRGIDHLYREMSLSDAIDAIQKRMQRLSGGRCFGLEVQDYHLEMLGTDAATFMDEVRKLGFSKFLILKRNPIRKLISHIVATQRGQHHAQVTEDVKSGKASFNFDRVYIGHRFTSVEQVLGQFETFFDDFEKLLEGDDVLQLSYAAHVEENPVVAYDTICGFLELEPQQPTITLKKTTQRNLEDVIENYPDFENRILQSRFKEDMLQVVNGEA